MAVCGIMLDIDGTLVDSNDAHARAWQETLAEFGFEIPYERARGLIGMGSDNYLPNAIGVAKESELGTKISEARGERFKRDYLHTLRPFPQVRELVEALQAHGIKLVIATSSNADEMAELLRIAGIDDLVPERVSADDAEQSKPDPDLIHAALRKLHCRPEAALMLGDTPYDIEAARAAGVSTIALRCGGFDDVALNDALARYDSPADLLSHLPFSPVMG